LIGSLAPWKRQQILSTRIPVQLTRFIGREQEIGDITRLLTESRLLTLTGPGGCGKTRLAAAVATQVEDEFEDGAFWVDLASIADDSLLSQAIAKSVDVKEQPGRSVDDTLVDLLQEKQILLIIDNCEHLIAECARLVSSLLSACPDLHVLATSREPLALAGERVYSLPPLSLPPAQMTVDRGSEAMSARDELESLTEYEAVALFIDRAAAIVPGYSLTQENGPSIAEICIRLDGMPLAIELAAARVNVLTAEQIADRLDNRFTLLRSDERVVKDRRHQTLRAAIDWSYDLLTEPEQLLLQRLSVFAGGCSLEEAELVCASEELEREQVLDLLASLVKKSLVTAVTLQRSEARYALLETIRQYGQEKLQAAGEWPSLRDRHLRCFLQLTLETEPRLWKDKQQLWLNLLADRYDNIRAALRWSRESGKIEEGLRIGNALYQFWTIRDYADEGQNWLAQLLEQADEEVTVVVRANALDYALNLAAFRGNYPAAERYGQEAAAMAVSIGNQDDEALMWTFAAQSYRARLKGDHQAAFDFARRELELLRKFKDAFQLAMSLTIYSFTAMSLGEYDEARAMLDEGLPLLRQAENPYRLAMALNFSGDLARCERSYREAQTAYEESVALLRDIDAVRDLASALHNLGHACLHLGDVERATAVFKESMALHREQGNRPGMTECLLGFAALAIVSGLPAVGACLLSGAAAIGGRHVTSEWAATSMEYEHYLARARTSLSESTFTAAQLTGQRFSLEQAVALAEDVPRKTAVAARTRHQLDQLTAREREVAILIAKGKSNDEIAAELVISKRTVETHITRIRAKLGFSERTQIVRWAFASGLLPTGDQIHL
jgi:predicted ATPase/DNA-binding CsgD family transcriptional regulator